MKCEHCGEEFAPLKDEEWDLHDGRTDGVPNCVRKLKRRLADLEEFMEARPKLGDKLLTQIWAEIIKRTGDGPLAEYVTEWLQGRIWEE